MQWLKLSAALAVGFLVVGSGCRQRVDADAGRTVQPGKETNQPNETAWVSDPALEDKLGTPDMVKGYVLRPPKGYKKVKGPSPIPSATLFAWASPNRSDGTAAMLSVAVTELPPGEKAVSLDEFLESAVDSVKQDRTNWHQSKTEYGTINGLEFGKVTWSGIDKKKKWKMQGFIYVGKDGPTYIRLGSQDLEPHLPEPLKIAEAAARTFKKK